MAVSSEKYGMLLINHIYIVNHVTCTTPLIHAETPSLRSFYFLRTDGCEAIKYAGCKYLEIYVRILGGKRWE